MTTVDWRKSIQLDSTITYTKVAEWSVPITKTARLGQLMNSPVQSSSVLRCRHVELKVTEAEGHIGPSVDPSSAGDLVRLCQRSMKT